MSRSSNIIGTTVGIAFFAAVAVFIGAFIAGYVMNIIQLFSCDFSQVDIKEMLKIAGAVPFLAPIGAIMGWIG